MVLLLCFAKSSGATAGARRRRRMLQCLRAWQRLALTRSCPNWLLLALLHGLQLPVPEEQRRELQGAFLQPRC